MSLLKLSHITKSFDGMQVVDDLSLSFEPGRIISLIGPNGAGKTTLFNIISGLLRQDSGEMVYRGERLETLPAFKRAQRGIGRLWQDVRVFEKMTVLDNVSLAKKGNPGEGILSNLFRIPSVSRFERQNLEQARRWLDFVGLAEKEKSLAGDLSYGQQKLLAIARLLANDADLLLLDEPTSGIHPHLIETVLGVIERIVQAGKTVILIEHNFGVVFQISDWVHLMVKGRIELSGKPKEIATAPLLKEVYLGAFETYH
jgi:ABC-type branched-subunit amino acid transport system ATPase component